MEGRHVGLDFYDLLIEAKWPLVSTATPEFLELAPSDRCSDSPPSNPLLTPYEVVDLGDEDQKRNGIPIFLADEIDIEPRLRQQAESSEVAAYNQVQLAWILPLADRRSSQRRAVAASR